MAIVRASLFALGITAAATTSSANSENATAIYASTRRLDLDPNIYSFCGVDLVGGDIASGRYPNPDACVAHCLTSTGCDSATWTNFEGGTCWFKRVQDSPIKTTPKAGSISFLRRTDNMVFGDPNFYTDVDMPGNDIDNRPGTVPSDCVKQCARIDYCFAYTWSSFNGGTCWFKSKASPFVAAPGVTARYSPRVANPDTCLASL